MIFKIKIKTKNLIIHTLIAIAAIITIIALISELTANATGSKIKSLNNDFISYKESVYVFKLSHECIPGDCPNIQTFLSHDAECKRNPTKDHTIRGNGDKKITLQIEREYFWCHLMLSDKNIQKLRFGNQAIRFKPGINIPHNQSFGGGFMVGYLHGNQQKEGSINANTLIFGKPKADYYNENNESLIYENISPSLTTTEARKFLIKYDITWPSVGQYRLAESKPNTCLLRKSDKKISINKYIKSKSCIILFAID